MSRVISFVFDSLFERGEKVSHDEKKWVVGAFVVLTILTTVALILV